MRNKQAVLIFCSWKAWVIPPEKSHFICLTYIREGSRLKNLCVLYTDDFTSTVQSKVYYATSVSLWESNTRLSSIPARNGMVHIQVYMCHTHLKCPGICQLISQKWWVIQNPAFSSDTYPYLHPKLLHDWMLTFSLRFVFQLRPSQWSLLAWCNISNVIWSPRYTSNLPKA